MLIGFQLPSMFFFFLKIILQSPFFLFCQGYINLKKKKKAAEKGNAIPQTGHLTNPLLN